MKLPFIQFFPADYQRDTRALSLAAKGGWVDVLCMLHTSSTRGSMTLPVVGWARVMGATVDQAEAVIAELEMMDVANVQRHGNGNVTLESRRMKRDELTREQTRLRVQKHRLKGGDDKAETLGNGPRNEGCNGTETGEKTEGIIQKSEIRKREGAAPPAGGLADLDVPLLPVVLTFPCVGKPDRWALDDAFLAELRRLYPTIDPLAEAHLAHSKIERGAVSKKTAKGMSKFLFSWMDRASNGKRPVRQDGPTLFPAAPITSLPANMRSS